MAHITEIKIDGLLGRSDSISFKLNRDVNIFFGENGGGKTTLLKILDAAMSRDDEIMASLPIRRAEVHIYSIAEDKTFKHVWERKEKKGAAQLELMPNFDYLSNEERRRILFKPSSEGTWTLSPKPKGYNSWSHIFLPTTRLYLDRQARPNGKALTEADLDTVFAENVNRSWLTFYSRVMTQVSAIQETGLRNVVNYALAPKLKETVGPIDDPAKAYDRVSSFLSRGVASKSVLGSKSSFLKRYESEENLRRIVDTLNTLEHQIEEAMIPINRFESTLSKLFSNNKTVSSHGSNLEIRLGDGRQLLASQLSSGEKHLLKIFLDALQAGPNALIIDEPELSMHIDWQKQFVRSTLDLNPNCQLILASHSPEIMADVDDRSIFRI